MANAQETERSTTEGQQQQGQEGVNPQAMDQLRDLLRNAQGSRELTLIMLLMG